MVIAMPMRKNRGRTCCIFPSNLGSTELKYVWGLQVMTKDVGRCDLFFVGGVENKMYQSGPQQEANDMVQLLRVQGNRRHGAVL